jgi:hypothetical protein
VLKALGEANLSPTKLNIIAQTQNALAPEQPYRIQLNNMLPGRP